ncbi:MAG: hypothetical protein ABSA27_10995, partial [Terriglobales bacterium]
YGPDGPRNHWMGHAGKDMSSRYNKIREDVAFRRGMGGAEWFWPRVAVSVKVGVPSLTLLVLGCIYRTGLFRDPSGGGGN